MFVPGGYGTPLRHRECSEILLAAKLPDFKQNTGRMTQAYLAKVRQG